MSPPFDFFESIIAQTDYKYNQLFTKTTSFFVNIGRADTPGSGMRNLYKYTRMYSHADPVLSEGDVFEIRIPLKNPEANIQKSEFASEKPEVNIQKSEFAPGNPEVNVRVSDIRGTKMSLEILKQMCRDKAYNVWAVQNRQQQRS